MGVLHPKKIRISACVLILIACLLFVHADAGSETYLSGKVITSDGKVVTSGAVALEKGELHNNVFVAGGKILSDGTFKIPLSSSGPWGLHVYSEGYLYFPLQIQIKEGLDNEIPVILPLDGEAADDPKISDIRFKKVSDQVIRITMRVDDGDGNLGPQMLAIDTKRFKSYRMLPPAGDLQDKKANFPSGEYVSPFIPAPFDEEELKDWLFVVADHQCSNGPIYDGLNRSVFSAPVLYAEVLKCEATGIWKSNFGKVYRFALVSPGQLEGEQLEGEIVIDRLVQKEDQVTMGFRFEGKKGEAKLRLDCEDSTVMLKGTFDLPDRSGEWIFTKLRNEKSSPQGQDLFAANCAVCHFSDRTDAKVGPGLKDLFKNPQLPGSGRPTSEETVQDQIQKGGVKMPPFRNLTEEEVLAIIDYLKTL
ncbi:MAG: c-type cytochrome [Proteobacteria bacterium]|nr:c-type cytochrome [Pseudomonadota bacterium]